MLLLNSPHQDQQEEHDHQDQQDQKDEHDPHQYQHAEHDDQDKQEEHDPHWDQHEELDDHDQHEHELNIGMCVWVFRWLSIKKLIVNLFGKFLNQLFTIEGNRLGESFQKTTCSAKGS